jgi:glycosyltransferase involved in cell wall biosynthesis
MKTTSLTVIVPVFNEEHLVEKSLNRLYVLKESPHLKDIQVIVVNDNSTDRTQEILKDFLLTAQKDTSLFRWKLINHEMNYGKGKAIRTALEFAENELVIIHDADLEYHPRDILRMIPLFLFEGADAVYGSRFFSHDFRRVLMFRHQLGNKLLTFISNLVSNINLSDMETCYKVVKRSFLQSIPLVSNDFCIEPEITIKLAKREAKIFEVPISYSGRTYAEGKKINWKDGLKAIWAILKFGLTDDIYTEDEYGSRILSRLSNAKKYNKWLAETISPYIGDRVLEIGAGIGNLTKRLIPRQKYDATDINSLYLQLIKNLKHNKPYLDAFFLDIKEIKEHVTSRRDYDTVICMNVIEHLDNDRIALNNIAKLLSEDGNAIIMIPQYQWLFGSLDKMLGHRRRYSTKQLYELAQKTDFAIEQLIYFNRISTLPWFINGRILKKKTFSYVQIFIMDFFTPIWRILDKILPIPSLSLIAILKRNKNAQGGQTS